MAFDLTTLNELTDVRGGPGDEYTVGNKFIELISPHVDTVDQDPMGNVIATQKGTNSNSDVAILTHLDELALIVDGVTDDGFLTYSPLGGHYVGNIVGERFCIGPNDVIGVVGTKATHQMTDEERSNLPENLVLDIGANSKAAVEDSEVDVGHRATWDTTLTSLSGDRVTSRALDNRAAVAVAVEMARQVDSDRTVHYVGTVQEEVGLRGARTASYSIDPDIALSIDIANTQDYPATSAPATTVQLGGGPVLQLGDGWDGSMWGGMLTNKQILSWLTSTANDQEISFQKSMLVGGVTDGREAQQVRGGRLAGSVGIPCRYAHSSVEMVDVDDLAATVSLLTKAVQTQIPNLEEVCHPSER